MWAVFNFRGRLGRMEFWRLWLRYNLQSLLAFGAGLFAMLGVGPLGGLMLAPIPILLLALIAIVVRRLHDRGKGVWWALLFLGGPTILAGIGQWLARLQTTAGVLAAAPLLLGSIAVGVWGLVEVGFRRGEPRANAFGEPPAD